MKALALVIALAACAGAPRQPVRFANAPAVTAVDDRRDTPEAPEPRDFVRYPYHLRGQLVGRLTRPLALPVPRRARGINALDEVPDSTWFTNRIGVRELTPDEIRNGPTTAGSPEPHVPWTIKSTKVGGASLGFVIEDARGEKFILKFDERDAPEIETAADAITGRLLWAIGYNVPEDHVVYFRPGDLVLSPKAKIKDKFGHARPLKRAELETMLATVAREPDGRIRGLASRMLDGTWLGGHPGEGVRADDPNDRIPHELRRDLRGAYPVFAWLDHVDVKEDNSLDMWVADPAEPSHHYVKHYWIDFGKALGAMAAISRDPRRGHVYAFDLAQLAGSFASAGLRERSWEDREAPGLRGVGLYDVASYDPAAWKPYTPSYVPFLVADDVDKFWGAKLVMRFTPEQLRAAVDAGRLGDPRAAEYLTRTLIARQRATARYYFTRVAPLDGFTVEGDTLAFDDLLLTYELAPLAAATRYEITTTDRAGRRLGTTTLAADASGRTRSGPLALAPTADGYTVVELRVTRPGFARSTFVHLARKPGGPVRVIGVWRP